MSLLLYYERELDYLRKSAAQFAEKHPKVASRLVLEPTKCEDPHVERLLEASRSWPRAFISSSTTNFRRSPRRCSASSIRNWCGPFLPCRSWSFSSIRKRASSPAACRSTATRSSFRKPVSGVPCTFRTCYDTTLWPITVTAAELNAAQPPEARVKTTDSAWAIRLELRCAKDVTFDPSNPTSCASIWTARAGWSTSLYELLFSRLNRILDPRSDCRTRSWRRSLLPASALQRCGLRAERRHAALSVVAPLPAIGC